MKNRMARVVAQSILAPRSLLLNAVYGPPPKVVGCGAVLMHAWVATTTTTTKERRRR
jgi:hypothetical protein